MTFKSGLVTVIVVAETFGTVFEVKVPLIVEVVAEVLVVGVVDAALLKAEIVVEILMVGVVDAALLKAEVVVEVLVVGVDVELTEIMVEAELINFIQ